MTKQQRIEKLQRMIRDEQSRINDRKSILEKRFVRLTKIALQLDDPHALIHRDYKSVEDMISDHPNIKNVSLQIYKNKNLAEDASYSCYTYQYEYHIVKCESKEYYQNLLLKDEKK